MAEIIIDGRLCIYVPQELNNGKYCVALSGVDEQIIQGSRLSSDFDGLSAAFSALETIKSKHPNASVFSASALASTAL